MSSRQNVFSKNCTFSSGVCAVDHGVGVRGYIPGLGGSVVVPYPGGV